MRQTVVLLVCGMLLVAVLVILQARATVEETASSLPLDAHMNEAYTDDLPGLLQRHYIRVLTTLNRSNFFIFEGHLVGYEYSLLKAFERDLNQSLAKRDLRVVLEFIPVARDELMPRLRQGYGDIAAAGLTITPERKEKVAFTTPYLDGVCEVVVTRQGGFTPKSVRDLAGTRVYVRKSSSYFQSLTQLNKELQGQDLTQVRIVPVAESLETESLLEMVNSGGLGITVADSHIAQAWGQVLPNLEIHSDVCLRRDARIAWMVRKDNPELLARLNQFLKSHRKGTLLGNIYFNRYYRNVKHLRDPGDVDDWQKLKKYKHLIQKYASQYGFDWLLILATAFQESGLDHSRTSPAGAVGLMQVLPSTAKDDKVGIANIQELENNIHAGIKYLAFLREHYFSQESIRPRDRVRLSLAAYNAGPAKVRRMRKEATRMGLDPDRWFRNVELAALKLVGQETVRYVSNINKYYVLYKTILSSELQEVSLPAPDRPVTIGG